MAWIALLLIGFALADLVHAVRPVRIVPEATAAILTGLLGLFIGLTSTSEVLAVVAIILAVVAWGQTVTAGFAARLPTWVPLAVFAGSLAVALACAGLADPASGPLAEWVAGTPLPFMAGVSLDRALLVVAVFLVQLSTGNVVVRLVLAATGTVNPARHGQPDDPEMQLKGGRLLGPMERVFILALAIAGEVTAASIVVAAKGLLRFPELSSRRDQERIHLLTEYFLVGSFVSWLIALAGALLLA